MASCVRRSNCAVLVHCSDHSCAADSDEIDFDLAVELDESDLDSEEEGELPDDFISLANSNAPLPEGIEDDDAFSDEHTDDYDPEEFDRVSVSSVSSKFCRRINDLLSVTSIQSRGPAFEVDEQKFELVRCVFCVFVRSLTFLLAGSCEMERRDWRARFR